MKFGRMMSRQLTFSKCFGETGFTEDLKVKEHVGNSKTMTERQLQACGKCFCQVVRFRMLYKKAVDRDTT